MNYPLDGDRPSKAELDREAWLDRQYAIETLEVADPEYWRAIVSQPAPVADDDEPVENYPTVEPS